jgi:hypothetical protein
MMYDLAHWPSEIRVGQATNVIQKSARAIGGWPGAPDHTLLPDAVHPKSAGTDPLPPLRNPGDFYNSPGQRQIEFLSQPGELPCENVGPPGGPKFCGSPLDTLMVTSGSGLPVNPGGNPCMTWYHGMDHGQFVFSGFNIWSFRRDDCVQLADFVLKQLWGLNREAAPVFRFAATPLPPAWTPAARRATPFPIRPASSRP